MKLPSYLVFIWLICLILTVFSKHAEAKQLSRNEIEITIINISNEYGIDPDLALAIAKVESNLNPHAIGKYGEIGVYQLRPEFHKVHREDTIGNIRTGIKYLARLKVKCSQLGDAYFICYNNGPYRIPKHPRLFPYYKKVKLVMNERK